MAYLHQTDFYLEVSKGNIAKHSRVNKMGHNEDVDTTTDPEDMWDLGGLWVPPTTARVHSIVSTSLLDTGDGTGARTITIQGLDGSYNYTTETVTLNGTVPVNTANSYTIIDFMFVVTAGSLETAQGTITALAAVDLTISAQINVGNNQTHMAVYQIRDGYKGYINSISSAMHQNTAGSSTTVYFMTKNFGEVWRVRRVILLNNSGNSQQKVEIVPPLEVPAKCLIKLQIFEVTNSSTAVEGGFDLTLIQD